VVQKTLYKTPSIQEISSNQPLIISVAFLIGGLAGFYIAPLGLSSQAKLPEYGHTTKVVLTDAIRRGVVFAKCVYTGAEFIDSFDLVSWFTWKGNQQVGMYYDTISHSWEQVVRQLRNITIEGRLSKVPRAVQRGLRNGLLRIDEDTNRIEFIHADGVLDCDLQLLKSQSGKPSARPPAFSSFPAKQFLGSGQPMPTITEDNSRFTGSFGFQTFSSAEAPRPVLPNGKPKPGWKLSTPKDIPPQPAGSTSPSGDNIGA
jgi:hypothetical protein